jgi:hypothetical protein
MAQQLMEVEMDESGLARFKIIWTWSVTIVTTPLQMLCSNLWFEPRLGHDSRVDGIEMLD